MIGYKINRQKCITFLYANNELVEKLRQQSSLQLRQKIKYLGINLTKEVEDLYSENYKTTLKETKWKDIHVCGLKDLNC